MYHSPQAEKVSEPLTIKKSGIWTLGSEDRLVRFWTLDDVSCPDFRCRTLKDELLTFRALENELLGFRALENEVWSFGKMSCWGLELWKMNCWGLNLWKMSCWGLKLWKMSCWGIELWNWAVKFLNFKKTWSTLLALFRALNNKQWNFATVSRQLRKTGLFTYWTLVQKLDEVLRPLSSFGKWTWWWWGA